MTIKVGEVGKSLYVGIAFDLNAAPYSLLKLKFTSPDGTIKFERDSISDGITAPAVDSPPLFNVGVLPANTYMLYKTKASDFTSDGNWIVCSEYQDLGPSLFYGDDSTITIEASCD